MMTCVLTYRIMPSNLRKIAQESLNQTKKTEMLVNSQRFMGKDILYIDGITVRFRSEAFWFEV